MGSSAAWATSGTIMAPGPPRNGKAWSRRHDRGKKKASHPEAEGAQLLAAVVGDLVRAPRRHPDPVDPDVVDQAGAGATGEGLARLVLDDVGQRAGRRGQRHVEDRH